MDELVENYMKRNRYFDSALPALEIRISLQQGKIASFSYGKPLLPEDIFVLEVFGDLTKSYTTAKFRELSLRECLSFVRTSGQKNYFQNKELQQKISEGFERVKISFLHQLTSQLQGEKVDFPEGMIFSDLSLVEQMEWVKKFIDSRELDRFREQGGEIELLDIQDHLVVISLKIESSIKETFLDWLHLRLTSFFRENALNLICE